MKEEGVIFLDKKVPEDPEELWDDVISLNHKISLQESEQSEVSVLIKDTRPIGLAFTGDWHIGSRGTDYEKLREDTDKIAQTDGLYCFTLGDEFDNYVHNSPKGGKFEAILSPEHQKALALSLAKKLKGKVIASVFGCHTNWSRESDDYNWVKHSTEKSGAANLGYGGRIYLEMKRMCYTIDIRHRYLYNSSLNYTNTYIRHLTNKGPADVVAFGHFHNPFVATQFIQDRQVYFIRNGSYKIQDRFAQRLGGWKGIPGIPMVILYPDTYKIEAFEDFYSGLRYLNFLREKHGTN